MLRRLYPIPSVALALAVAATGMLPGDNGQAAGREKPAAPSAQPAASVPDPPGRLQSLDGQWQIAKDPADIGKSNRWYSAEGFPRSDARPILVPGNIYEAWCRYNGVAWYGRRFTPVMSKTDDAILNGLPAKVLTPDSYGPLLGGELFGAVTDPEQTVVMRLYCTMATTWDGLMVGIYRHHAGKLTLNALDLLGNLGNPAADRMLLNMAAYAATDAAPVQALPADYDAELNALGIVDDTSK